MKYINLYDILTNNNIDLYIIMSIQERYFTTGKEMVGGSMAKVYNFALAMYFGLLESIGYENAKEAILAQNDDDETPSSAGWLYVWLYVEAFLAGSQDNFKNDFPEYAHLNMLDIIFFALTELGVDQVPALNLFLATETDLLVSSVDKADWKPDKIRDAQKTANDNSSFLSSINR